jgi:hypothetical protein
MVELGRSCVHAEHRHGGVILALWGALADFMVRNQLDTMVVRQHPDVAQRRGVGRYGGQHCCGAPDPSGAHRIPGTPASAFARGSLDDSLDIERPLLKGHLRLGAKVLGAPAWDPDFTRRICPCSCALLICLRSTASISSGPERSRGAS